MEKVILFVQSLLDSPNPHDFLNQKTSKLYKENRYKYEEKVKEYTSKNMQISYHLKMNLRLNILNKKRSI